MLRDIFNLQKNETFVIAEVGVNHNGDINTALKLIDAVLHSGANAIKFQAAIPELVATSFAKKANYQIKNSVGEESQLDMIKKIHLPLTAYNEIQKKCQEKDLLFFATAFDLESLKYIESLDPPLHKVPSGEITNLPYLREIASYNKPTIISTGMASLNEIQDALDVFDKAMVSRELITILHCNTEYPSPFNDLNLRAMQTIATKFNNINIGYSDHSDGIEVPIAAVALGAKVIEKHITLDKNQYGPDHLASIEPEDFKSMVKAIRNIEKALGSEKKLVTHSEKKNKIIARRSIVASKNISKGEPFSDQNIISKRPEGGISPMLWDEVIGKPASRDFEIDEQIVI